ncbi:MAG: hypothetical protein ACREDD_01745 [Methylocella sp.]
MLVSKRRCSNFAAAATRLTGHTSKDADLILRRILEITNAVRSARHAGLLDRYEE